MGRVTLTLPRLGETMEEAKVTEWLVAPGADFARGDVLLEVETDKTVVEVPALEAGKMLTHLVAPGDSVDLDAPIAEVEQEGQAEATETAEARTGAPDPLERPVRAAPRTAARTDRTAASPAARAEARRRGMSVVGITGTGRRGRVTAADIAGGATPTVVLIHGLFDDSSGWRGLPRRLRTRGLTVVALDLPGHGENEQSADSFEGAADHLAARLPPGPLLLVGHSLGAALAARLATMIGARAQSLTLFAPAGLGVGINGAFIDGMAGARDLETLRQALSLLDGGPMSDAAISQQLPKHLGNLDLRLALARVIVRGNTQQIDATADIATAPCPVTVIFGTADRILDWRDVAHLPAETRIHLIPNAGHLPHLVRPDLAAALIASRHDLAESA
ncbi:MAG: alpha/beta fold hydrolase [Jannaschia sp.]